MSYLNPDRIHFAGRFRADVSTINNASDHYDNADFQVPQDQMPGAGWWQPAGTGAWRIDQCAVTAAYAGGAAQAQDPVVGMEIRDAAAAVSAKLVDLDPNQQLVSTIFGLEVRIVDAASRTLLMSGKFDPVGFYDIWWGRSLKSSGDIGASACYHSVLTEVEWGDVESSPALKAIKAASQPGLLSIKFMTDGYAMTAARRGYGRMVGTIGPQLAGDPRHFVPGRHLAPLQPALGTGTTPPVVAPLGYVGCWFDAANGKVIADFGNALHTAGSVLADVGPLHLLTAYTDPDTGRQTLHDLGQLAGYAEAGWYEKSAGIQAFPPDRPLTADEISTLAANPLWVAAPIGNPPFFNPFAVEPADGVFARPDQFVFRMEPDASQDVPVMALQFGAALAGVTIGATVSGFGLQPDQQDIPVASPLDRLTIANQAPIVTDQAGWATVTLAATDPGWPRQYLDGQVYAVELAIAGAVNAGTAFSPSCFVSVLLFSHIEVPATVDWTRDVQPILQQYSNLYPRPHGPDRYVPYAGKPPLHPVVNLSDEAEVTSFAPMIARALKLPIEDPNHMPVVRDLSAGRRQILLAWCAQVAAQAPAAPAAARIAAAPDMAPARHFAATRGAPPLGIPPESEGAPELTEEPLGGKSAARLRIRRPVPGREQE